MNKETRREIEEAFALLSDSYREVIVLRCTHEYPFEKIAALLGIAESTARVRYLRARQELAKLLSRKEGGSYMNCQEFRKAWEDTTNESTLFHIETCEECMVWIEAQFANGEEVQFLKEVPRPSAQLEDNIMQAIYKMTGQESTPQAAAALVVKWLRRAASDRTSLRWHGLVPRLSCLSSVRSASSKHKTAARKSA